MFAEMEEAFARALAGKTLADCIRELREKADAAALKKVCSVRKENELFL